MWVAKPAEQHVGLCQGWSPQRVLQKGFVRSERPWLGKFGARCSLLMQLNVSSEIPGPFAFQLWELLLAGRWIL